MSEDVKLEKNVKIVFVNGEALMDLDEPVFTKKVQRFFPFETLMNNKKSEYFAEVLEELHKIKPIDNSIIPYDIFFVEVEITEEKDDDDCELE